MGSSLSSTDWIKAINPYKYQFDNFENVLDEEIL